MIRRAAFKLKTHVAGRQSLTAYRDFLAMDHADIDQLRVINQRRSVEHARFAMLNSPFYREYYGSHGIKPGDLSDPDAFTSLPFVDKQLLRENFAAIRSTEATHRNSALSRTGGSTGFPLHILRDLRFPARALEWRLFDWWGVNPWDDRGIITRHMLTGAPKLKHDLGWLPSRRIQLDAFNINDDTVRDFVARWNRLNPPFLLGYGGGVLDMARRLDRLGLTFAPPRAIAVTAAPLAAGVRAQIQDVLGAPCYDHYRSAEIPWIAGECREQDGLHVFWDVRRVEILDEHGTEVETGQEGDVVVTDLTNRVFPVVRYRLGDISSFRPGSCPCGRSHPRLGVISGRRSDAIRLPDGTTIAGALGHIFDDAPLAVRQFEIVQAADYGIVLRCIPGMTPDSMDHIRRAHGKLKSAARGLVPVQLAIVDEIPQIGGKMRFIRSDAPVQLTDRTTDVRLRPLRVAVAIPTFCRPEKLGELLAALPDRVAEVGETASIEVLVVDNDPAGSAERVVAQMSSTLPVRWIHEKSPGIACARNRALDEARDFDLLAFIDDDERPLPGWLIALIDTWLATRAAAVMGRVISVFDEEVDPWLLATGVFRRRERVTGSDVSVAAAGNLLLDLKQVRESAVRFDPAIGLAGGEDTLFSRQLVRSGRRMVWCNESRAEDFVPPERLTRAWAMKRAFNGGNIGVFVELSLASGRHSRLSVRIQGLFGGSARMTAGWTAHLWGRIRHDLVANARGLRTAHRGRGMFAASIGHRHLEYSR